MQTTYDDVIQEWVAEAAAAAATERRDKQRHPFFRPVTMTVGSEGTELPACSRDISLRGIGLLHDTPLETRHVTLTVPTTAGRRIDIGTEIIWCEPSMEGWYLSGGRFLGLSAGKLAALLFAAVAAEADRRLKQRHPFFRPVTMTVGGPEGVKLSGFSRDISLAGIGLLHSMPLETRHLTLTVPTTSGDQVDIRTEIMWCERSDEGWYLSGGRFVRMMLVELPALLL